MNRFFCFPVFALMACLLVMPAPLWCATGSPVASKEPAAKKATVKKKSTTRKTAETQQPASSDKSDGTTYSNQEFGFSFTYPETWTILSGSMPNMRVKVADRTDQPTAECALIVKRFPKAASAKQSDIDQIFTTPPTTAELEEVLGEGGGAVKVTRATSGHLHRRPAHVGRVHYKIGTNAYGSGQVVMTATPGLTWTLSCSGLGDTPAAAEKNFQLWQSAIDGLIASFLFK